MRQNRDRNRRSLSNGRRNDWTGGRKSEPRAPQRETTYRVCGSTVAVLRYQLKLQKYLLYLVATAGERCHRVFGIV